MLSHSPENYPNLAHTLVEADRDRVEALAARYGAMADAVGREGRSSPIAHAAWRSVLGLFDEWGAADHAADLKQLAPIPPNDANRIMAAAKRLLDDTAWLDQETGDEVISLLERTRSAVDPLPRRWALMAMRAAARVERLVELGAPEVLFSSVADDLTRWLYSWREDPPPFDDGSAIEWDEAHELLRMGLEVFCLLDDAKGWHADVGLGRSGAVLPILGLGQRRLTDLILPEHMYDGTPYPALELLVPEVAHPGLIPPRRFHDHGPGLAPVRDHMPYAGPAGWAASADLEEFIEQVEAVRDRVPSRTDELSRMTDRLRAVAMAGRSVVGLLELMHFTGDGVRHIFDTGDAFYWSDLGPRSNRAGPSW